MLARRPPRERPEEELLRLVLSTETVRRRASPRIRQLLEHAGYEPVAALARIQWVLGLAGSRIREVQDGDVPDWFAEEIDREIFHQRRFSTLLAMVTTGVLRELDEAGIRVVPLKGVPLAELLYDDAGLRFTQDIDLLVSPRDLNRAREVLLAAGHVPLEEPLIEGRPLLHYRFFSNDTARARIELHWRMHWYETAFSEDLLERSAPGGGGFSELSRADGLAALLLFWIRDGLVGLRYAADAAAWWDRFGNEIEPGALGSLAAKYPELARPLRVAAVVAADVVGIPVTVFGPPPLRLERREAVASRLANLNVRGDVNQIEANRVLIDALVTPPGAASQFLRRQMFPTSKILKEMYGVPADAHARLGWTRAAHPAKLMVRFGLALGAARGGRRRA